MMPNVVGGEITILVVYPTIAVAPLFLTRVAINGSIGRHSVLTVYPSRAVD